MAKTMIASSSSCKSFINRPMSIISTTILFVSILLLSIPHDADAQFEDYCIADEQATDDLLQGTMNWACSNGANCTAIQENQNCFFPNTTMDHASYAFNSYYQNMKHNGAGCYFTAAAVLTALDPSHGSCKFEYLP